MHYGVLGMKWGKRRQEAKLAKIGKKAKKRDWSSDAEEAAKIKTKKVSQMSNAELKKINERTRLENEYSNLRKNKKQKGAGAKFVSEVVRETAKDTVKSYTTPLAKKYAEKGVSWATKALRK